MLFLKRQQERGKHPAMLPQGCCPSRLFGVTPLLDQCPPELTHTMCSGEKQGSDQLKGRAAAPGKARSQGPFNSPSPASWPRLSFTIYFCGCPPPEIISKGINEFPLGKKPILSWPLGMSAAPKAGLYPLPFRLLQWLICQKTPHHLHGDKPLSSTPLLSAARMQPLLVPKSTKQENRAQTTEMRINIHEAPVLTPRWRAARECQEPAVNLTTDCWPHTSPDTHEDSGDSAR